MEPLFIVSDPVDSVKLPPIDNDPVIIAEPLYGNPFNAYDAEVATDDDIA